MMGLTTDLGRVYIAKNELQAFADASAMAAALKLNGTSSGVTSADSAAATGPVGPSGTTNGWYFASQAVSTPTVTYSTTYNGTYNPSGSADVDSRFVKVLATANVPLYFMPILPGVPTTMRVDALAMGGQRVMNTLTSGGDVGGAPFSPDAHNPADLNFGLTKGTLYTLRMTPPGHGGSTCPGDVGWTNPNPSAAQNRGYIDLGQGNSNSGITDVLVNNYTYPGTILQAGDTVPWVPGQKHVGPDIHDRFYQDTDTTAGTFANYHGNGRRILIVPVNDPALSTSSDAYIIGFAAFFLQNDFTSLYGNVDPLCGEYIGTGTLGSTSPGPPHTSANQYYAVQLFQ
jgi:hypothetical protein